jgi:hypothetical protein
MPCGASSGAQLQAPSEVHLQPAAPHPAHLSQSEKLPHLLLSNLLPRLVSEDDFHVDEPADVYKGHSYKDIYLGSTTVKVLGPCLHGLLVS